MGETHIKANYEVIEIQLQDRGPYLKIDKTRYGDNVSELI